MKRESKPDVASGDPSLPEQILAVAAQPPQLRSICHVLSGDCWAGAEVQAATLVSALCRNGNLQLSAIVLNEGRLASELRQAGAIVKVIPESQNSFPQILHKAVPFVRQQHVQVLHSHRYKENLLSHFLALCCRVPVIVRTKHGMPEPFKGWSSLRQSFYQQFDRWTGRFAADAIIGVSAAMEQQLRLEYGSRKVVTIRNGLDTANVVSRFSREEAKAHIGCTLAPVIGMVGRLEPVKRVDLFLAMAGIVANVIPDVQFVVAGDGALRQSLLSCTRQPGLQDNVRFLGHREDIHDVLRALDVLVMCSDHEGLPMVLLEALWLGVPVVARAVGGIREIVENGRNGFTVSSSLPEDFAAACLRLLADHTLGEDLCRNAAEDIKREFSMESNAESILGLYRKLYARSRH
jgi:glycosyltransferase involved in cell wall biosynthesis